MQTESKINIDMFTRPTLLAADQMLTKAHVEHAKYEAAFQIESKFIKNESAFQIETELTQMGVFPSMKEANLATFAHKKEANELHIFGDDDETVVKTIPLSEAPALAKVLADYRAKVDEFNTRVDASQTQTQEIHDEAWGMIYNDLVAMGVYPSVEEAKKDKFTLKDGRFLRTYIPKPSIRNIIDEALEDLLND
jgi:hypothetical protein